MSKSTKKLSTLRFQTSVKFISFSAIERNVAAGLRQRIPTRGYGLCTVVIFFDSLQKCDDSLQSVGGTRLIHPFIE